MKEIEILVHVLESKKSALKKLHRLRSLKHDGTFLVVDHYFYDPLRKGLQPNKKIECKAWFRIRTKADKAFLTYKQDIFAKDGAWLYSDEQETAIGDARIAEQIVKSLGLKFLVEVRNTRTFFRTARFEITLEDVKGIGLFLEVEQKARSKKSVPKIRMDIMAFMRKLGLKISEEVQEGKPEMLLKKIHSWRKV